MDAAEDAGIGYLGYSGGEVEFALHGDLPGGQGQRDQRLVEWLPSASSAMSTPSKWPTCRWWVSSSGPLNGDQLPATRSVSACYRNVCRAAGSAGIPIDQKPTLLMAE